MMLTALWFLIGLNCSVATYVFRTTDDRRAQAAGYALLVFSTFLLMYLLAVS